MNYSKYLLPAAIIGVIATPVAYAVDEVTVTVQRRDSNLQETPVSVTAIGMDDIGKLGISQTADIAAAVPNLQTYSVTANANAMQVFMRGAGVQNPGFIQSESPVGIYVDGIYRGRLATANLELADIERIEVLRGPQGTLYGRNTIAGAIKLITRTPEDEFWLNASVGVGNFETGKITASVGGPLIDGELGGSLSALYGMRDKGWVERGTVGGRELGEYDNGIVRGKLNWFGNDAVNVVLTTEFVDIENDGYNGIPYDFAFGSKPGRPVQGFYDTLVPDETTGFGETKATNIALDVSWDIGDVTLRSLTGFANNEDIFRFDLNAGGFGPGVPGFFINSDSDNDTISQEFTVSGTGWDGRADYIAGIFFMKEDGKQMYQPQVNFSAPGDPFFFGPAFTEDSETETDSLAFFAEGTWQLGEKLSATLGARFTIDEKMNNLTCSGAFCTDRTGAAAAWASQASRKFNEFTPRLLVQYQATDNTMVFGGVSRGFQAGGFQTLCFGNQACSDRIYNPQTVTSYEFGVKTDQLDDTLRVNLSTFFAKYSGLQQTAVDPNPGGVSFPLLNVGGVNVFGIELESTWTPTERVEAFVIAGFAKERFDRGTKERLSPGTEELPGKPSGTLRVGADYRAPAFNDWDWLVGGDVSYVGDYYATINNSVRLQDYTRVNARLGLDQPDGNWSVMLAVKNLNDQETNVSGIFDTFNGINIRTPLPPREVMLTVGYRYK